MKIYCSGIDLADAVSKVSKALSAKPTMTILEGIKLVAVGGTLTLIATDTYFTIQKTIRAEVLLEGEVVVHGKIFGELMRTLSGERIELELCLDSLLKIRYGDSESNLQCLSSDEFPPILLFSEDSSFSIKQSDLKDLINKIIFSAATDEARPILKGCLLELSGTKLCGIALDGYRLAIAKKNLELSYPDSQIVVPSKSLSEISKLLDGDDEFVTIKYNSKRIMADCGHTKITSALLEGNFMNYKQIIALETKSYLTINRNQLLDSLNRVGAFCRSSRNNQVMFKVQEKLLSVLGDCSFGNAVENIPASLTGVDLNIAFNIKFLIDCLKEINDEFIKISFSSSTTPSFITPLEGDDFLYLVLPIRLMQ